MRSILAIILLISFTVSALSYEPDEVLDDPALEARARALSVQLRCLVCQNQSIDDSDAPLARDLRILLRARLKAGDSDAEAKQFLVDRYGEFVLLKPAFALHTLALWFLPFLLLIGGFALIVSFKRQRRHAIAEEGLSPEEQAKLEKILK